jgi:hypothetical protein
VRSITATKMVQFSWEVISHICTFNLYTMSAICGRTNPPLCSIMEASAAHDSTALRKLIVEHLHGNMHQSINQSINHRDEPCVRFRIMQQNGLTELLTRPGLIVCVWYCSAREMKLCTRRRRELFQRSRVSSGRRVCAREASSLVRREKSQLKEEWNMLHVDIARDPLLCCCMRSFSKDAHSFL